MSFADGSEQEARGRAAEAATRLGRGSDTKRGADRQSTQETAGCRQRTLRTSRPAAEGQTKVYLSLEILFSLLNKQDAFYRNTLPHWTVRGHAQPFVR